MARYQIVIEKGTKIVISEGKLSKKLPVFYNPKMTLNRDLSILLLNSLEKKDMQMADLLAGSGIRSLRFIRELEKGKIKSLFINDYKKSFKKYFTQVLKLNKIKNKNIKIKKIKIFNQEANHFLLDKGFDYIDIDPFGSPNPFLERAVRSLSRGGILAATATDLAPLAGTFPLTCQRKYWAQPIKNELMHEIGLRILIRKIQLVGMQFDKALFPIFSYYKEHYYRVFFSCQKSKKAGSQIFSQHQYFLYCPRCLNRKVSGFNSEKCDCKSNFDFAGPLWTGSLGDRTLIKKMLEKNLYQENEKFLQTIFAESKIPEVGFYELHKTAKIYKTKIPPIKDFLKRIKALPTHFSPTGFKTEKSIKEIIKLLKKQS